MREALLGPGKGPHRGAKDVLLKEHLRSGTQWGVRKQTAISAERVSQAGKLISESWKLEVSLQSD